MILVAELVIQNGVTGDNLTSHLSERWLFGVQEAARGQCLHDAHKQSTWPMMMKERIKLSQKKKDAWKMIVREGMFSSKFLFNLKGCCTQVWLS